MRLLIVADIHGRVEALERIITSEEHDLLLIAGDMASYSGMRDWRDVAEVIEKTGTRAVAVPGNVDGIDSVGTHLNGRFVVIHADIVEIDGITIAGIGGGTGFPSLGYSHFTDEHIGEALRELEKKLGDKTVHILLTHTPPYGTKVDVLYSGEHAGSVNLRNFIEAKQPIINACGHVHEARGTDKIGNTTIINPGPLMWKYYAIAEIDENGIKSVEMKRT